MKRFAMRLWEEEKQQAAKRELTRAEVDPALTWDTAAIFATPEIWEEELRTVMERAKALGSYAGKLGESGASLLAFLQAEMECLEKIERLYVYAHLRTDEDTADSENQGRMIRVSQAFSDLSAVIAFERPELVALGTEKVQALIAQEPGLELYRQHLDNVLRFEAHTLSEELEKVLAEAEPVLGHSAKIFGLLNNAGISFAPALDSKGEEHLVTHGTFGPLLESKDRVLRKNAFASVYAAYKQFQHAFAATLSGETKLHNFEAKLRGFSSARAAAVFENNIPEEIQQNLIDTVHRYLPLLHDYVAFRKEKMGLSDLYPYDLYPSIVESVDLHFTIEEAEALVLEALKPLGEKYVATVRRAFSERWIDWVNNKGKRSGAYSSGTYGTYPYILMSWQGTLDNVYTLIHELGHSMHSFLTWENQPFPYASYCIFLAEIASTTNENLLTHYLLQKYQDPKMRAYILNNYLDGFKGTVFRQTQFAEFEQILHRGEQAGEAITAEWLCEKYGALNREFYGAALDVCEEISFEWARIPHFYYNFYVYQYSTGFSAATAFAKAILEEGEPAVKRYLNFLSSGCSQYPIETLQKAGVDMSKPEPIETALETFRSYLETYKELVRSL